MSTQTTPVTAPIDPDALMEFVFRAVDEVGASLNCALVVMGDRLGYYRALAERGPLTAPELAEVSGTGERYAAEWLNAQAAGDFVRYDPGTGRYTLPAEHAVALTDETSPAFLPGFFQFAFGTISDASRIFEIAGDGDGLGWGEHNHDVHEGCERFFRPGYLANLSSSWLPSLAGVVRKLERGARVHDLGCGHGASTVLMAESYPASRFLGSDAHAGSITVARERAKEAGVADRVQFEVASSTSLIGAGYDLVTTFDALHDMGDPVGCARRVHEMLDEDGTWMIVEPIAGDRIEDNLNPVGRTYYCFSTLLCTPSSLSQDVGLAIGTQAGPARIRDIVTAAGFTQFRIAAQTPLNNVLEVRK
jgi:SAM-dependent methyltransferase